MQSQLAERPTVNRRHAPQQSQPDAVTTILLSELLDADLPRLEVVVYNAKHEVIADVEAPLTALIISPMNRVLYLEAACSSDSAAHALMGSVADPRGAVEFRLMKSGGDDYFDLLPLSGATLASTRLNVPGWSRKLHHVAMLDRSGELLLARDEQDLWHKLRERMTCPTLEGWGTALLPQIHSCGLLVQCQSVGVTGGVKAYVLAENAKDIFDRLVSQHIRKTGLPVETRH